MKIISFVFLMVLGFGQVAFANISYCPVEIYCVGDDIKACETRTFPKIDFFETRLITGHIRPNEPIELGEIRYETSGEGITCFYNQDEAGVRSSVLLTKIGSSPVNLADWTLVIPDPAIYQCPVEGASNKCMFQYN